jgi:molybdopterin-guanine dinucleotide biosynthesis protein A
MTRGTARHDDVTEGDLAASTPSDSLSNCHAMTFDGVIVAGGSGARLGGAHKPALTVGDRRLLDIAIDALAGAEHIVVVGAPVPTKTAVAWVRESPPGGGPVAAIAAALLECDEPEVVVLAADLPFVTAAAVASLRSRRGAAVASMAVDDDGRDQPLLACYDAGRLREAMPRPAHNASMRALTTALGGIGDVERVALGGEPPVTWDCDTEADLERARKHA